MVTSVHGTVLIMWSDITGPMVEEKPENIRRQYRNPEGEDGRTVLEGMNEHHEPIWQWCLSHMPDTCDGPVLDVGCGGGGLLHRLSSRYPDSMMHGVDISRESLDMTARVNNDIHVAGRLQLHECSVDSMPFDDCSMDLVTAVETYFFWPDLEAAMDELYRILAPGGSLYIGSEMQLRDDNFEDMEEASRLYHTRLVKDDAMLHIMETAGFYARACPKEGTDMVVYIGTKD